MTTKAVVTVDLDESELATVLAALRLFQRTYEYCSGADIAKAWPDHFSQGKDDIDQVDPPPLGTDDIDTLCEQINCSERVA